MRREDNIWNPSPRIVHGLGECTIAAGQHDGCA